MTAIASVTLEVPHVASAEFYEGVFGVGKAVRLHASDWAAAGFRGFTLSLVVSGPGTVDKYVEFENSSGPVKLALYGRRALAKDAGVPEDGSGSHRIVIGSDAEGFVDPDGFLWEGLA